MSDAAKNFDIPATSLNVFYIIILTVQQNYSFLSVLSVH